MTGPWQDAAFAKREMDRALQAAQIASGKVNRAKTPEETRTAEIELDLAYDAISSAGAALAKARTLSPSH